MTALLAALCLALAPLSGAGAAALGAGASGARPGHDLHISYGNAVVEGNALTVRIRFFRGDLEEALARHAGSAAFHMGGGPEVEAAFLAYFQAHFAVGVGDVLLEPTLVGSGEDELDREPVWWYAVHFEAADPIVTFTVRNALLTELYDDQTNIVKFVRFPEGRQKTYSFARGEERFEIRM